MSLASIAHAWARMGQSGQTSPAGPPSGDSNAVFTARGLSKSYQMGEVEVVALRSIDLDIVEREFLVLLGPSGSGKSTLLNILGGLDAPTGGQAWFRDHDLVGASESALTRYRREHVGFVFQFYNLIPSLTVRENVSLVTEIAANPMDAGEALRLVGLDERLDHFPSQLSGGEQQRVAIARALVHAPRFIIADEPTGNLDPATAWEIMQLFLRINARGATVVMATHNREIVDLLRRRVIAIDAGQVARDDRSGRYHDDLSKPQIRAQ
jgi:putative ABC transport system ATP-binding protein